jgi:hypothetical protein
MRVENNTNIYAFQNQADHVEEKLDSLYDSVCLCAAVSAVCVFKAATVTPTVAKILLLGSGYFSFGLACGLYLCYDTASRYYDIKHEFKHMKGQSIKNSTLIDAKVAESLQRYSKI